MDIQSPQSSQKFINNYGSPGLEWVRDIESASNFSVIVSYDPSEEMIGLTNGLFLDRPKIQDIFDRAKMLSNCFYLRFPSGDCAANSFEVKLIKKDIGENQPANLGWVPIRQYMLADPNIIDLSTSKKNIPQEAPNDQWMGIGPYRQMKKV